MSCLGVACEVPGIIAVPDNHGIVPDEKHHDVVAGVAVIVSIAYFTKVLRVMPDTMLFAWRVRHASFMTTYFHVRVHGQTSNGMLKGCEPQWRFA